MTWEQKANGEVMDIYEFSSEQRAALEGLRQPFAVYQYIEQRVVTLLLSDGFLELFGYTDRAAAIYDMNNHMYKDLHPDDAAWVADAAIRFATEGGKYETIYRTKIKDGQDYHVIHALGEHVYTDDGIQLAQVWYTNEGVYTGESETSEIELTNILSHSLQKQSILNEAHYDFLTGLPNMTYFFELVDAGKEAKLKEGEDPALVFFDMSGMKFYNRKYGFAEGDKLIKLFARLLVKTFSNENCCHIAGDHFAAFTEAANLEDTLNKLFSDWHGMNKGNVLPVRAGIYLNSMGDYPPVTACDRAKFACDSLSNNYISEFGYYKKELRDDLEKRQYVLSNFDRAIANGWIKVYYQPIVRAVSGKVCDEEALARWIDPDKGFLSPADFIPYLEDAGQIYKLDLYVLDQVLDKIRIIKENGLYVVPQSINLSRSDFYTCDIVEEVRRRVDAAGISHELITLEITESIVGGDIDFIKSQCERFQQLGFPVWMDDFGSGYSSMNILQKVRFDLIKFDMSFMKSLGDGDEGKIILTELMKMATALGMDTVCEGVETEEQVRFLQTIGCSKLQGYYYLKPIPLDGILKRYREGKQIGFEDPRETAYFDNMSRINLYDLSFLANKDENDLRNTFDTLPMGIIEVDEKNDFLKYVRTNESFREFINRALKYNLIEQTVDYAAPNEGPGALFIRKIKEFREDGDRIFIEEKYPDGTIVHSFARRIGTNPLNGRVAIAMAILSITDPDAGTTYAAIARALAADYLSLYYIDLTSEYYIEYSSKGDGGDIAVERHGTNFFTTARKQAKTQIYEKDQEVFLDRFTRENILRELDEQGSFQMTYRLLESGKYIYARLKIMRMEDDKEHIIIGVSIIDAQMRQQEKENRLRQEKESLGRIAALSSNYIVLYTVDPVTGHYTQFNPSNEYENFDLAKEGENFFSDVVQDAPKAIAPEDIERHLRVFTKENMLRQIEENGFFIHNYRLLMGQEPVPVVLKATLVREDDGEKILLGVMPDDKEEFRRKLREAYEKMQGSNIIHTHIAQALARGYTDLYYVNMETDELIEYHTDDDYGVLTEVRRSSDFFEGCKRDVKLYVHPDDQEAFVKAMDRDFLTKALKDSKVFNMTYRRILNGRAFYVDMKVSKVENDERFIVLAVSDIDELVKKRQAEEKMIEERIVYARLHALTGNFIVVYVVDLETDKYREFSATDNYVESFAQAKEGEDFFDKVREVGRQVNHPQDIKRFLSAFTKKNIMSEIERTGIFTFGYRIMMDGKPVHVQLKAAMVEEKEGPRLVVGLNDIDTQVRQEEDFLRRLAMAQTQASIDALTGVKNKYAYQQMEYRLDRQIKDHRIMPFAILMLDINDLKKINDTTGHQAGDQLLKNACSIICDIFKRSPVYRVGGDEFVVIALGKDYAELEERLTRLNAHNKKALETGGVVIACGMAKYEDDPCVADVYERADKNMYENKKLLKRD